MYLLGAIFDCFEIFPYKRDLKTFIYLHLYLTLSVRRFEIVGLVGWFILESQLKVLDYIFLFCEFIVSYIHTYEGVGGGGGEVRISDFCTLFNS